jgi:tetratricopeptide (TPR) repeat protein
METNVEQKYRRVEDRLNENGLFDEPRFCMKIGAHFASASMDPPIPPRIRQAVHQFIRVQILTPQNLDNQIWLANLYLKWPLPEKTLEVVQTLEANQKDYPLILQYQIELIRLRAWAYASMTNLDAAVKVIQEAVQKYPNVADLPETLSQIYLKAGQFTNALTALELQLKLDPNNTKALLNKGALHIQLKNYPQAIPPLTLVVQAEPKNSAARLNRAVAFLRNGQWDSALSDYEVLSDTLPESEKYRAYYGLGEANFQLRNTNDSIRYFNKYLDTLPRNRQNNQPRDADEAILAQTATNRLQELQGSAKSPR